MAPQSWVLCECGVCLPGAGKPCICQSHLNCTQLFERWDIYLSAYLSVSVIHTYVVIYAYVRSSFYNALRFLWARKWFGSSALRNSRVGGRMGTLGTREQWMTPWFMNGESFLIPSLSLWKLGCGGY